MAEKGSEKGFRGSKSTKAKDWAAVIGATALLGAGGGALAYSTADVPSRDEVAVSVQSHAAEVNISDPADLLTADDDARLMRDAERLQHPDTVKKIHFIVLNEGRDNVNDSVENFLRDNFPEEIGNDRFADGVLIIGADMNGRHQFVFGGVDVLDQLKLWDGQRLDGALDAMVPGLRDNNIPAGLFAGANYATDTQKVEDWAIDSAEDSRSGDTLAGVMVPGVLALGGGSVAAVRRERRRKAIAQAKADYAVLASDYTGLSQRLDELDIRANSVSSAFANAELRSQWEEVRDNFLQLHDATQRYSVATDRQAWENREALAEAAATITGASNAEDNINRLFDVERGDPAARRHLLTDIREDIIQARLGVKDRELKRDLGELEERVNWLDQHADAPDFVDQFVRVLGDYRVLLDEVKRRQFSDVKEREKLRRPVLTDPGYVYYDYVPYIVLNNWHSSNVEAEHQAQASSSSGGTNTSFSSGFSGGGGSGSF